MGSRHPDQIEVSDLAKRVDERRYRSRCPARNGIPVLFNQKCRTSHTVTLLGK